MSSSAIYYHPEGFTVSQDGKLMGRHVAGESFMRGYIEHNTADQYYCFTQAPQYFDDFKQRFPAATMKSCNMIEFAEPAGLEQPGCLFLPGPGLAKYAYGRRMFGQKSWSLVGVTHTIASERVMEDAGKYLTAPIQPWDAVICTSQSVKTAFEYLLDSHGEYLAEKLNCKKPEAKLQLPIIPLGLNAADFAKKGKRDYNGKELRRRLNIGPKDVAVLFVGRLSFHAKAHPFPMMAALENVAKETNTKIHLIQAGWFANDSVERSFKVAAQEHCPNVNAIFIDARKPDIREFIWHAADIFCSLSDNIQETFGITPIEAMAAELPVVATDWDGYRETVVDQEHGFLVPTIMTPKGSGEMLAYRHSLEVDNYDYYLVNTSQATAVDVDATTQAFKKLIEDPELRKKMGKAGAKYVAEKFDWKAIIPQYEALWDELADIRKNTKEAVKLKEGGEADPLRPDPFRFFAHYPTYQMDEKTKLKNVPDDYEAKFAHLLDRPMTKHPYRMDREKGLKILKHVKDSKKVVKLADIRKLVDDVDPRTVDLWVGWMLKFDLLRTPDVAK